LICSVKRSRLPKLAPKSPAPVMSRPTAALAVGASRWRCCVSRTTRVVIPATSETVPLAALAVTNRSCITYDQNQ
jgi:hypothetical protein